MASTSPSPSFPLQELCTRALSSPSSKTPSNTRSFSATQTQSLKMTSTSPQPPSRSPPLWPKPSPLPTPFHHKKLRSSSTGPFNTRTRREPTTCKLTTPRLPSREVCWIERVKSWRTRRRAKPGTWRIECCRARKRRRRRARERAPPPLPMRRPRPHRQAQAEAAVPNPKQVPTRHRKLIVFPWERTDWIGLLGEKDYPSWGLVVLRTAYDDPAAWLTFKRSFDALAARELDRIAAQPIAGIFSVKYIEDEDSLAGAEQAGLLAYYARLVREGKVSEGYRWGIFVSVDEKVLEIFSAERREWVVPVWEAGWRAREVGRLG